MLAEYTHTHTHTALHRSASLERNALTRITTRRVREHVEQNLINTQNLTPTCCMLVVNAPICFVIN